MLSSPPFCGYVAPSTGPSHPLCGVQLPSFDSMSVHSLSAVQYYFSFAFYQRYATSNNAQRYARSISNSAHTVINKLQEVCTYLQHVSFTRMCLVCTRSRRRCPLRSRAVHIADSCPVCTRNKICDNESIGTGMVSINKKINNKRVIQNVLEISKVS